MSTGRRRYNFVLRNLITGEDIKLKNYFGDESEFGKSQYFLSAIDSITTNYINDMDMYNELQSLFGYYVPHYKFFIKYKDSKQDKYLEVAYQSKKILKQYAKIGKTYIDDGPIAREFYQHFMSNIAKGKGKFYRYMGENQHITPRLSKILEEYVNDDKIYREEEIKKELKRYKMIRDYLLGVMEFNKKIENRKLMINIDSLYREESNIKNNEIESIKLNTDDKFLNSLTSRDEILTYYDLDELDRIENDEVLFDGLYRGKNLVKKKR